MKPAIDGQSRSARSRAVTTSSRRAPNRIVSTSVVKRDIGCYEGSGRPPCNETCPRAFCTAIAETASIPATVAMAAFGSIPGPAATQMMREPERSKICTNSRGHSESRPIVSKPPADKSRQAEQQHEDQNRQDRSLPRSLAGDDMRGNYRKVAGDVSGKQSTLTRKAEHIHAPRSKAKHARQQPIAEPRICRRHRQVHHRMGSLTAR
jgi:hypothetical protein